MGGYSNYSISLIRSASGQMPVQSVREGGKFLLVITGDMAGATVDLRIKYAAHPVEVVMLGLIPEKEINEIWLPIGTEVSAAIMGGSPTGVNATLILIA